MNALQRESPKFQNLALGAPRPAAPQHRADASLRVCTPTEATQSRRVRSILAAVHGCRCTCASIPPPPVVSQRHDGLPPLTANQSLQTWESASPTWADVTRSGASALWMRRPARPQALQTLGLRALAASPFRGFRPTSRPGDGAARPGAPQPRVEGPRSVRSPAQAEPVRPVPRRAPGPDRWGGPRVCLRREPCPCMPRSPRHAFPRPAPDAGGSRVRSWVPGFRANGEGPQGRCRHGTSQAAADRRCAFRTAMRRRVVRVHYTAGSFGE